MLHRRRRANNRNQYERESLVVNKTSFLYINAMARCDESQKMRHSTQELLRSMHNAQGDSWNGENKGRAAIQIPKQGKRENEDGVLQDDSVGARASKPKIFLKMDTNRRGTMGGRLTLLIGRHQTILGHSYGRAACEPAPHQKAPNSNTPDPTRIKDLNGKRTT